MFGDWVILYSAAIRFTNDYNLGIYIVQNPEDETDIVFALVDENTSTIIYPDGEPD